MPKNTGTYLPMELLPKAHRIAQDKEFQISWYQLAGQLIRATNPQYTVLDAGAGMGYGHKILERMGLYVESFDLVQLVDWVRQGTLDDYAAQSFDAVLAMDVIEHVPDDERFLGHLLRIARHMVFFSTPNWLVFGARNEHHYREYTPAELMGLLEFFKAHWKRVQFWTGDEHYQVHPVTGQPARDTRACNFGVLLEK